MAKEMKTLNGYEVVDVKAREGVSQLSEEIAVLEDEIFENTTVEFVYGTYSVNGNMVLYSPQITVWKCAKIDVAGCAGETYAVVSYSDRNHPIIFSDVDGVIIDTIAHDTGNATLKWETEITVPEGAAWLYINNYAGQPEGVTLDGYKTARFARKDEIPEVTQETGDDPNKVMSQKAVTKLLGGGGSGYEITPVSPVNNIIPVIDNDVPCYLENMFIGISPRETKLVATQNAYIRIYDKSVALVTAGHGIGSGQIRLYMTDNSKYDAFANLRYGAGTAKTGSKKVLFIGDSMTENLSYITPLKDISDNGDYKITFLGTLGADGMKNEGRSGWAAYNYVTNDLSGMSTNKTNVFWDGSAFNFAYYMQNSGIDVPDYVFINLGTNDMLRGITDTNDEVEIQTVIATSYRTMIDSIRAYSTTIPIVLWLPPTRSLAGRNNHLAIDKCLRANKWLIDTFDKTSYINNRVYLMPTYLYVDPYTDYTMSKTVIDGIEYDDCAEPIHPSLSGGEKIARGIMRQMMYIDGLIE